MSPMPSEPSCSSTRRLVRSSIRKRWHVCCSVRIASRLLTSKVWRSAHGAYCAPTSLDDVTAVEVLANIDAMSYATSAVRPDEPISGEAILEVHRRLLLPTRLAHHAGRIRTEQNCAGSKSRKTDA